MHDTAIEYGSKFFETYLKNNPNPKIVDIGAMDMNGSLRSVAPKNSEYIGVDCMPGRGVEIVTTDPYNLPIADNSVDAVVSSSCYEHCEFFWLSFNESLRILKPSGFIYINAPSNGPYHRCPTDCWRFYPDSGLALQNWGRRSGYDVTLLESFIGGRKYDYWNDYVAVFVKDSANLAQYNNFIQGSINGHYCNGHTHLSKDISNYLGIESGKVWN